MRPRWGLRAELTEAAVEAARKSPVSRTIKKRSGFAGAFLSVQRTDAEMMQKPPCDICFCAGERDIRDMLERILFRITGYLTAGLSACCFCFLGKTQSFFGFFQIPERNGCCDAFIVQIRYLKKRRKEQTERMEQMGKGGAKAKGRINV